MQQTNSPKSTIVQTFQILLAACVSSFALVTSAEDGEDWAGYRGPDVAGIAAETRAFSEFGNLGLKTVWKTKIGSGYSGQAIAGGKVVTQYADGESDVIAAFDAGNGRKLWSYAFSETYTGHDGSHDGPVATPLIADGRVFGLGPRGEFFAVDFATGKEIWSTHLGEDHEIPKPHYGYGTSPILVDGVLILELGGEGSAIAGFDPATGEKKWSAASDAVGYQVPVPMTLGGRRQVLGAGETKLFGVDAASGEVLWEWEHEGGGGRGAHSMTPVPVGPNKIFLAHQDNASKVIELGKATEGEEGVVFDALWENRSIRNSYNVPVVHDGHVYAFSSRFLTCVDAATGETKWRSREPGDGFLIVAGGRLVIVTKNGSLHVAEASPEGYNELAAVGIFEDQSWTAPSFAGGSIYARSFGELARLDLTAGVLDTRIEVASRGVEQTAFGKFLAEVDAAPDEEKAKVVDRFMKSQKSFPIVEGDRLVHFVYRGASDVAVAGDPFGARQEQAMTRVPGTEFFYHSVELEPDSRINYLFIKDYEEVVDPLNPNQTTTTLVGKDMEMSRSGEAMAISWLAMPKWRLPAHLEEAPEAARGTLANHEMESPILKEAFAGAPPGATPAEPKIELDVYLPHGYEGGDARFPVAYVHNGKSALEHSRIPNSLDNLIGKSVEPVIVVFVSIPGRGPQGAQAFVKEVVPFIDETYRTVEAPEGRANIGANASGIGAMINTLQNPDLFGKVATQSVGLITIFENMIYPLLEDVGENPPTVYMDWSTYGVRNPHENWDIPEANRKLARAFTEKGVRVAGGEFHHGAGWSNWSNRTDKMFEALFPLR